MSRSLNTLALACATGAVCEATRSSATNSSPSPVFGAARLRSTGVALMTSGRSVAIVLFSPSPRPARPSPKLIVFCWIAVLVFWSNMLNSWLMSTGSRVCETGIVAPAFSVCEEVPFSSSRYFSPTAETDCTITFVSAGSGSNFLFQLQVGDRRHAPGRRVLWGLSELTIAHARARDPHLVGRLQPRGFGQHDFQVVRRHERQPVVGVVGEEHRDDHDQRRDRADQQRAARQGVAAARVHGVSDGSQPMSALSMNGEEPSAAGCVAAPGQRRS